MSSPQSHPPLSCQIHSVNDIYYLLTNGPDLISNHLKTGQPWEGATLAISQILIKNIEQPILLDIGANLGAWSVPMGKFIQNKQGKIFSFEPQRAVFYQLCANYFLNNLMNCHAHYLAIGQHNGKISVPQIDAFQCSNLGMLSLSADIRQQQGWQLPPNMPEESVDIRTLDSLELPAAHLIKIDVEGLELEVLEGAQNYLQQSHYPPLLFEIWQDNVMPNMIPKREKLLSFVKNLGYECFILNDLCIAQHQSNLRVRITRENNQVQLTTI